VELDATLEVDAAAVDVADAESSPRAFSIKRSIMSIINGAIKSLMFMPMLADGYMDEDVFDDIDDIDDMLFIVVINDMISLNEERISDVEDVLLN
jgi:hypothetical protein